MSNTRTKIEQYIRDWNERGYPDDIPDEVPEVLMKRNLAPSYKAISLALLRNDLNLESLGFSPKKSQWYSILKKIEIDERNNNLTGEDTMNRKKLFNKIEKLRNAGATWSDVAETLNEEKLKTSTGKPFNGPAASQFFIRNSKDKAGTKVVKRSKRTNKIDDYEDSEVIKLNECIDDLKDEVQSLNTKNSIVLEKLFNNMVAMIELEVELSDLKKKHGD